MRQYAAAIIILLGLLSIGWLILSFAGSGRGSGSQTVPPAISPPAEEPSDSAGTRYTLRAFALVEQIASHVTDASSGEDRLAEAARDTLATYLSGSLPRFRRYFEKYGIAPIPAMQSAPDLAERAFVDARRMLAHARFDPGGIRVIRVLDSSIGVPTPPPGRASTTGTRPGSRPFLDDIPEEQRRTRELVLPGVFANSHGSEFAGELVFRFTFSPRSRQWVMTALRFDDVPQGMRLPKLPL